MIKLSSKPYTPYKNYTIEYDNGLKSFDPKNILLHLEPEQEKGYIKGEVLSERMKKTGLTSNVLKYLIDHPTLIPEGWKEKYVYFHGTILRGPDGRRCVLCLYWHDGAWFWCFRWLGYDWDASDPSAVLASTQKSVTKHSSDTLNLVLGKLESIEKVISEIKKQLS